MGWKENRGRARVRRVILRGGTLAEFATANTPRCKFRAHNTIVRQGEPAIFPNRAVWSMSEWVCSNPRRETRVGA